jgi:hypothetical protein
VYTALFNLNIFALRDLGSNVDRTKAKRHGIWATRLYVVSLITSIIILVLYTIIQSRTQTKTFHNPSFDIYNHTKQLYGDQLRCPCSFVASQYSKFVTIEAVFHEVRKNMIFTHGGTYPTVGRRLAPDSDYKQDSLRLRKP